MQPSPEHITSMPPIVLVGSGRVGGSLAASLLAAGADATLAGRDDLETACTAAEVVLLCVPDSEIGDACARVVAAAPKLRFLGHTSGVSPLEALIAAERAEAFSLHPLQTIPDDSTDLAGAPAAIAGTTADAVALARTIADRCRMVAFVVPEESRAAYHAAAAIASNFLIALEASAEELLAAAGIENGRDLLSPLVLRTAANWSENGAAALTGPIARGDEATVSMHLAAISEAAPDLEPMYRAMADRTREVATAGERR